MTIDEIKKLIVEFFKTKPYVVGNRWVMTNCPFSAATHADRDDKKFSFGISVQNGYHCFTCGEKGSIKNLPLALWKYLKYPRFFEMSIFIDEYLKSESFRRLGNNFYIYDVAAEEEKKEHTDITNNLSVFNDMPMFPDYVKEFKTMKFIQQDVEKWNIRYNFLDNSVLFPIYNTNNQLVNVKARKYKDNKKFFYFWCKGQKDEWYGIHLLSNKSKYLFLVEGERDAILLSRYVENVVASMGMPSIEMIKRIPSNKSVVLFFDNDLAGSKISKKVIKHSILPTLYVIEDYGFKDPAEVVENNSVEEVIKKIKKIHR